MAHTNPIKTPVLDPTSDTTTNTNVNDTLPINVPTSPMRLTFAPETMTLHGERNATNNCESTAVHDADEMRSVILIDPGTPEILLRAYDDLRGRISTSSEAIMNELSKRVVNDLTKRLETINARNNDELDTLRYNAIRSNTTARTRRGRNDAHEYRSRSHDHRCSPLPAAPFNEQVSTPPITSNPFTYDALPHIQTQTNRGPQYVSLVNTLAVKGPRLCCALLK